MKKEITSKTVYLHIGRPKTGTSVLQYFLLKNRDILQQQGIEYPQHHLDANGISSGNAEHLIELAKEHLPAARELVPNLLKTSCDSILLSSEYFFFRDYVENFKQLFASVNPKIIVYLRRQDYLVTSVYHQMIKRHGGTLKVNQWYQENYRKNRYTNDAFLNWVRVFGKENIYLRIYEKQQFVDGNIFSDFLDVLKIPLTDAYQMPQKRINPSYRIDALEAKRLFNILPLKAYRQTLDALLQDYSGYADKKTKWPYDLLSPSQRLEIIKHHEQGNAAIAREYLGRSDGRLYYDPLPDIDQPWEPYPGLSEDDVHRIAEFIVQRDGRTAHQVGRAVRESLKSADENVLDAAKTLANGLDIFLSNPTTIWDHTNHYRAKCLSSMRTVYHKMPVTVKKPIAAIARKLKIIH